MSAEDPARAGAASPLTPLPRLEDLPLSGEGFDRDRVAESFDQFRRHVLQLQAQLRVLQAAGSSARVEPTGHAVRMDALHLIRAAAEFADQIERDAQRASAAQIGRTEEEVRRKQTELQAREAEVERYRLESERQRADVLNSARSEMRELLANATRDATQELREAEARGTRLLEQSRHQATELTNAARAEVEQTLEWARAQASAIIARAQQGTEQLLAAAGLPPEHQLRVIDAIVRSAEAAIEASRPANGGSGPSGGDGGDRGSGPSYGQPATPPVSGLPPVSLIAGGGTPAFATPEEPAEAPDATPPPPAEEGAVPPPPPGPFAGPGSAPADDEEPTSGN
jgi:F0F1-type ATP synthase membrane subunit b/b'